MQMMETMMKEYEYYYITRRRLFERARRRKRAREAREKGIGRI